MSNSDTASQLRNVCAAIDAAQRASGRAVGGVSLVAVSKNHDESRIRPVLAAGHRLFGENRVQEAEQKWPVLRADYSDVCLHLIGPLQTNKVKVAVALFDVIETIDREKLARAVARECNRTGKSLPVFLQINTGEEPQKAGVLPVQADPFIRLCQDELGMDVRGLMCIPPQDEEPALHFALLAKIAARNGLEGLSMGMSGDFETAIAFGASHVRVGTAIFGERAQPTA